MPESLAPLWPGLAPTPLLVLPRLAARCGVATVWAKDESQRPLRNFKSLGGVYAGLRALARHLGLADIGALLDPRRSVRTLPALLCASDGNHGLAVAAGARLAGAPARIYLPAAVPPLREARIRRRGAEIVRIEGTYDDAVASASAAAARGEGLLIADTSLDPADPVVADVMAGYGVMADEILQQLSTVPAGQRPTHLFIQAGVGGLAAALAERLVAQLDAPARIVVVEPDQAACVAPALASGRIERIAGDLDTAAGMLSCGEASAPAVTRLRAVSASSIVVSESLLADAVAQLVEQGGPASTESGAGGLAGLLAAQPGSSAAQSCALTASSRVLLIVTEGPVPVDAATDRVP
ncbi:MAG TPA: pyridoxal-phosphate dependent enzyme [Opitutaceae bacterium]